MVRGVFLPDPAHSPNAFAKFQKKSITRNIEYRQKSRAEGGLCPILPILGVVPNAFAKFQGNSINNESEENTWVGGGLLGGSCRDGFRSGAFCGFAHIH